jgi:hypothetical protein
MTFLNLHRLCQIMEIFLNCNDIVMYLQILFKLGQKNIHDKRDMLNLIF